MCVLHSRERTDGRRGGGPLTNSQLPNSPTPDTQPPARTRDIAHRPSHVTKPARGSSPRPRDRTARGARPRNPGSSSYCQRVPVPDDPPPPCPCPGATPSCAYCQCVRACVRAGCGLTIDRRS
ncbi:hypothetical protein PYCCODRAFT_193198 [Trametes coccinea BRFM310]|uniref:Uncharacterized protein n=1 Tax=Trametes coccinea (strain BRFM310) TaxID=1353009 RepID=A0A1Y2IUX8_TRAC3|nr:hypothetical protein PYCCODRAFT_193198 [Trametes coccinea BRFM310]